MQTTYHNLPSRIGKERHPRSPRTAADSGNHRLTNGRSTGVSNCGAETTPVATFQGVGAMHIQAQAFINDNGSRQVVLSRNMGAPLVYAMSSAASLG